VNYWREEEEEGQKAAAKQNVPKPIERKPKGRTTICTEDCS